MTVAAVQSACSAAGCGEAKSATEYYVDPRRPGFTIARCKSCIAEYVERHQLAREINTP